MCYNKIPQKKWLEINANKKECIVCGVEFWRLNRGLKGKHKAGVRQWNAVTCSKKCSRYKINFPNRFKKK